LVEKEWPHRKASVLALGEAVGEAQGTAVDGQGMSAERETAEVLDDVGQLVPIGTRHHNKVLAPRSELGAVHALENTSPAVVLNGPVILRC
jgi:hypothetical protein